MTITILDIWLEKIRRGWSVEDAPNEEIKEAILACYSQAKLT